MLCFTFNLLAFKNRIPYSSFSTPEKSGGHLVIFLRYLNSPEPVTFKDTSELILTE